METCPRAALLLLLLMPGNSPCVLFYFPGRPAGCHRRCIMRRAPAGHNAAASGGGSCVLYSRFQTNRDTRIGTQIAQCATPVARRAMEPGGVRSGDLADLMEHARSKTGLIFSVLRSVRSCDLADLIDLIDLSGLIW